MRIYSILLLYPDVTYPQILGATEHNRLQQSNDRPPFKYTAEKEDKASSRDTTSVTRTTLGQKFTSLWCVHCPLPFLLYS